MKDMVINRFKKINITEYLSILAVVILVIFFTANNKNFLNAANIKNILSDMAPLLVVGLGVTLVLLVGSIDLSIGAIVSASAVILAVLLPTYGFTAYIAAIVFGVFAGFINGVLYTKLKIPSFISTLGTMSVWQSVAYIISKGAPIQIQVRNWKFINWGKISFNFVPLILIIALILFAIIFVIQRRTKLGKYVFAIGGNERTSRIAGINIDWIKIWVFSITGLCCAIAGILLAVKLKSGVPTVGIPLTLLGIAAVVLGGTSLSGGKGSVAGTLIGVTLVVIIQNGMNIIGVDVFWQQIIFGLLIILAVLLTTDRRGRDTVIK
jgi:ribose transport system permease protein